ncbi:MAG: cytochrome c biogenesis protein [Bacteroidales bacterium]
MIWENYIIIAISTILFLVSGSLLVFFRKKHQKLGNILYLLGVIIITSFVIVMWNTLQRPPMRTMGETRLWYAIFLTAIGYLIYKIWDYKWILTYSALVSSVFLLVNVFKPEIQSKNLMPALQSPWFIPHVSVYIMSYAMLGAATLMSIYSLHKKNYNNEFIVKIDDIVYIGSGMLLLGMLMGALWAKEVWCHFWSWDPKETWAFVTFAVYMLYVHWRKSKPLKRREAMIILIIAFVCLMITWKGVNYLPSAKASMHTYFN